MADDPLASVVSDLKSKMPAGSSEPAKAPAKPRATTGSSTSAAQKPGASGFSTAHGSAGGASKRSDPTRAFAAKLDTEEFHRRHDDLSQGVAERLRLVAGELHTLKRLQAELHALTGPGRKSVEEMRTQITHLSVEVEQARQVFEADKAALAEADERVRKHSELKEALMERLAQIVAQNEAAKLAKLNELMGSLEHLEDDDDVSHARASAAAAAAAAAEAVKRGGTVSSEELLKHAARVGSASSEGAPSGTARSAGSACGPSDHSQAAPSQRASGPPPPAATHSAAKQPTTALVEEAPAFDGF